MYTQSVTWTSHFYILWINCLSCLKCCGLNTIHDRVFTKYRAATLLEICIFKDIWNDYRGEHVFTVLCYGNSCKYKFVIVVVYLFLNTESLNV